MKKTIKIILSLVALVVIPFGLFVFANLMNEIPLLLSMESAAMAYLYFALACTIITCILLFVLKKNKGRHSNNEVLLRNVFDKLLLAFALAVMILVIVLAKQYTFVESNEFLNVLVVILIATLIVGFSLVTGFSFIILKRKLKERLKRRFRMSGKQKNVKDIADAVDTIELKELLEELRNSSKKKKEPLRDLQEKISYIGLMIACFLAVILAYITMV